MEQLIKRKPQNILIKSLPFALLLYRILKYLGFFDTAVCNEIYSELDVIKYRAFDNGLFNDRLVPHHV